MKKKYFIFLNFMSSHIKSLVYKRKNIYYVRCKIIYLLFFKRREFFANSTFVFCNITVNISALLFLISVGYISFLIYSIFISN